MSENQIPDSNALEKTELEKEELRQKIEKLKKESAILDGQLSKQEIEKSEVVKRLDKLDKEISILEYQTTKKYKKQESLKAYATIASVSTVFVSLFAIGFSIYQYYQTSQLTLSSKKEDRLTSALANLGDTSARKRLSGIIALKSFLNEGDSLKNTQALLSLAHALGIENSANIRSSILEVFASNEVQKMDTAIIKKVGNSLVAINRAMYEQDRKYLDIISLIDDDSTRVNEGLNAKFYRIDGVSDAILLMLKTKANLKDLSKTFFYKKKLKDLNFKKVDFSDTFFEKCSFEDFNCIDCDFANIDLFGCVFFNDDLSGSNFSMLKEAPEIFRKSSIDMLERNSIKFESVNLSRTSFYKQPLFSETTGTGLGFRKTTYFYSVKLDSADFENPRLVLFYRDYKEKLKTNVVDYLSLINESETHFVFNLVSEDTNWDKAISQKGFKDHLTPTP